ncbi:HNH endonuclease [Streptomyces sp. NPDC001584]|uniref:HNH endonuclease n=1 Tax=Streptomyces sp. NPDC001584 TaxID=3154521 RepID=UPI00331E8958
MIRVQRIGLPQQLTELAAEQTKAITKTAVDERYKLARELWSHSTNRRKLVTPLRQLLRSMAHGNRCCMYCCSDLSTDVDHFEPVAENPLRTFDWLNHLLACTECNSKKNDKWELFEDGEPKLIDPTREDPFEHLYLSLTTGKYEGLTEKGIFTRETCGLNRDDLPEARCLARDIVTVCASDWLHAWHNGNERRMTIAARTIREQPFADVSQFMLRQAMFPQAYRAFDFECGLETLEYLRHPQLRGALLA